MTTPNIEELIENLEDALTEWKNYVEVDNAPHSLDQHAAPHIKVIKTALQSQAERIAELDSLAANAIVAAADSQKAYMKLLDENFALRAELADMAVNTATYEHLVGLANDTATRLLKERDELRAELVDAELHTKQVERGLDKATAQLAEIEKTEPVAWINLAASSKMFRFLAPTEEDGTVVKDWQPLFTRPIPAQGVEASMIKLPEPVELNPAANSVMGHSDATLKQAVRDALDAQGVAELVEAFEHHIEQTRPIERSTIALPKYKGVR